MSVPAQLAKNITVRKGPSDDRESAYEYIRKDCDPNALHTFIRIPNPHFVLHARNLRHRLVISLPEQYHDLRTTRFFLVVQSTHNNFSVSTLSNKEENIYPLSHSVHDDATKHSMVNATIGSLVFRQDQLHIDLFVFFSVFFSCFFLFLSICVIVWKFKTMSDLRRARRRHAVEMQYMAQRPFASQPIEFEPNKITSLLGNGSSENRQQLMHGHQHHLQPPLFEPYRRNNQRYRLCQLNVHIYLYVHYTMYSMF